MRVIKIERYLQSYDLTLNGECPPLAVTPSQHVFNVCCVLLLNIMCLYLPYRYYG